VQKLHFVAQGAALSKVIDVSIAVKWWCGFAALLLVWRRGLVTGAAPSARSREAFAGLCRLLLRNCRSAQI